MVEKVLGGLQDADESSVESGEGEDINIDKLKKIASEELGIDTPMALKLVNYAFIGLVIGLFMFGIYNKGYADGYTYVKDFKENYEANYCTCFESSMDKITMPISERRLDIPDGIFILDENIT